MSATISGAPARLAVSRHLLPVLGLLVVALVIAGLLVHRPGALSIGSGWRVRAFVMLLAAASAAYFAACATVLRRPGGRGTLWLVLGVALAIRLPLLPVPPFLSSDLYRYVWDGRVQAAGINPYRYIPADPALRPLRDQAIYPHVNRREYAPTIYPPTAQLVFRAVAAISQTPIAIKATMAAFELLAIACLWRLAVLAALPPSRVLIYAWNPLAAWCYAGNGHVDALAIGLVGVTLLCRGLRRDGWAGVALGAAILVKFLPVVIAPAIWRPWRWRTPLACMATIVLLYAVYIGVGTRVLGFLSSYGREEGLSHGSGIWLLAGLGRLLPLPPWVPAAYLGIGTAALGLYALWIAPPRSHAGCHAERHAIRARAEIVEVCRRAGLLALGLMLLLTPHYPWYFPYLGLFAVIAPLRSLIWMSAAPLLLYLSPWNEFFLWPSLIYAPAIVLAAFDLRRPAGPSLIDRRPAVPAFAPRNLA